mmetsp:Transcript_1240/g.2720  ORF Transcript_1240/g.2720 Transcript_1240/m.2720 type:complete len:511 (-) Transcript_1240:72-1604(-)|eukprot:CAMPEP_0168748630 /NCGR_PEP_ID=MMETSP0724-20121128/16277_1 /TAXON_ID=265536 /ORGANISM="Amphiprora sp., Strain CCMP467" /LENGTH=510 /DNA_ID=CAMNT_0008796469 /DNA_START=218 /DNA_END=1750 /DNA_ORIENTATION=+
MNLQTLPFNLTSISAELDLSPVNDTIKIAGLAAMNPATTSDGHENIVAIVIFLATVAGTIAWVRSYFYMGMGKKCLPYAPMSFRELIKWSLTPQAVFGALDIVRNNERLINCRLRIPVPKGFYIIGDYKLQREIFMNSDKPTEIYQQLWFSKSKGDAFFSPMGSHWKLVRKGVAHAFSAKEIKPMSARCLERLETILKTKFEKVAAVGGTIDIRNETFHFIFDLFMDVAFEYTTKDEDFGCLMKAYSSVKESFFYKQKELFGFISHFYFPWSRTRFEDYHRAFAEQVYNSYVNNPNKSDRTTLIRIIHENDELTYHQKIDELMMFTNAGFETTGNAATNILVLLAKHPDVANKLRSELSETSDLLEAKSNTYLQWVIKEAMRMMPIAQSARKPNRDIAVKGTDCIIPKGSICAMPQIVCSRNHKIFENPDSFIPERWENASKEMMESAMPFAVGKRSCLGRALALAEIETIVPFIIQNFHLSVASDEGAFDTFPFLSYDKVQLRCTPVSN